MLTTILCDMGNVLLRYEPETFLDRYQVHDPKTGICCGKKFSALPCGPRWIGASWTRPGWKARFCPGCRKGSTPSPTT